VTILVQARGLPPVIDDTMERCAARCAPSAAFPPAAEDDFELFRKRLPDRQFARSRCAGSIRCRHQFHRPHRRRIGIIEHHAGFWSPNATREIAFAARLGRQKRKHHGQFIMEAIVLCELGGSCGVRARILAATASPGMMKVPARHPFDWSHGPVSLLHRGIVFGNLSPPWKGGESRSHESLPTNELTGCRSHPRRGVAAIEVASINPSGDWIGFWIDLIADICEFQVMPKNPGWKVVAVAALPVS